MKSTFSILTLGTAFLMAGLVGFSTQAFAQRAGDGAGRDGQSERGHGKLSQLKKHFDARDADSDGFVSKEEFGGSDETFDKVDADGDGKLSLAEVVRGAKDLVKEFAGKEPERRGDRFSELDKDGNKAIDRKEFDGAEKAFKAADSNSDGQLSQEELFTYLKGLDGGERKQLSDRVRRNLSKKFDEQDKDGDGKLSAAEFRGNAALLKRIDKDGDGFISLEEMTTYSRDLHSRVHDRTRDTTSPDRDSKSGESESSERPSPRRGHGRRGDERPSEAHSDRREERRDDGDAEGPRTPRRDEQARD